MKGRNENNRIAFENTEKTLMQRIEETVKNGRHSGKPEFFNEISAALKEAEEKNDIISKNYCHALLSEHYYDFFDEELFRYHLLEASRNLDGISDSHPMSAAIVYNMMGIDEFNKGNLELALEYYMNVINVAGKDERPKYIAMLNIACIHGRLGNVNRKLEFVKNSYEYFLKNNERINRVVRLNAICQYVECEFALGNVERVRELVREMDEHLLTAGEAVNAMPVIEASRIYYYMMISDDEGIESQLPSYLDKLHTVDNPIDYAQDITDLCYELIKCEKYRYVKQIIDAVFESLVSCSLPAVAMSILELCIAYYEAIGDEKSLSETKKIYYRATIEKREKDKLRMRSSLEFYESIINIKLQRNQAMRDNMRLQMESNTDALTGLPNRRMLNSVAESSFDKAFLEQSLLGFEILDIDFFKQLNDANGHRYGDFCLRSIADILRRIAEGDERIFTARYGGDEFCIIYMNMTDEEIKRVALKIREEVKSLKVLSEASDVSEFMTVSQGIRNSIPAMRNRTWDFMFAADTALYRVKNRQKGEILLIHTYKDSDDEWFSAVES